MAKMDKTYQQRMEGMLFAHKIATEKGIDGLEEEIKLRNYLKLDIWADMDQVRELEEMLSQNLYNSFVSTMMFTIHDEFGFGKARLQKLKEAFDKKVENIFDLDWLGKHYVRFEDYAKYLEAEYGFKFDVARIAVLQDVADEKNDSVGKLDPLTTIAELREHGFDNAAKWLEGKALS